MVGVFGVASAAHATGCSNVTIASRNWQSAEVLSNLDKIVLNSGYGCSADITTGDTRAAIDVLHKRNICNGTL